MNRRLAVGVAGLASVIFCFSIANAQIQPRLSAYTGRNAAGYLGPLVDAVGTTLNSGVYHSAFVPKRGIYASLELRGMAVFFGSDSRTFLGTTEGDFTPERTVVVPTAVGDRRAVSVEGDANTVFWFPGGFDVDNLPVGVPQLRVGAWRGTEAVIRYLFFDTGRSELGDLRLHGIGARHGISQYLSDGFPADLAVGVLWQRVSLGDNERGEDLIASEALSVGVQASRTFGAFTPYAGIGLDWFSLDVSFDTEVFGSTETIDLSFDSNADSHITFGFSYSLSFLSAYGEYNLAKQNALSMGLAFQYTSFKRSVDQ